MKVKINVRAPKLVKVGILAVILVAVAIPAVNLVRTARDSEGTVLFISDESVYLDGMTEPVDFAAAVQKPGDSQTQIVTLTKKQHEKLAKGDTVTFYYDKDGIARVRGIKKGADV